MYTPPNPFDHNNSQVGEHVTDEGHQQIAAEYLAAQKREMKLGSKICKSIEVLGGISGRADLLRKKIEGRFDEVENPYFFWKQLVILSQKLDELEADFFKPNF